MTSRLIQTTRKVELFVFKEYFSAASGKFPLHPLHEVAKDTKRKRLFPGNSSKIGMGNSRIACNNA